MNLQYKDFQFDLQCDYDLKFHCSAEGCTEEICRCSTIHNPKIKWVNIRSIVDFIYSIYFDNSLSSNRNLYINYILFGIDKEIELYTIDRILRINKIYMSESWDIDIYDGYYGEEIKSITLKNYKIIEKQLDEAFLISELGLRIEYLLNLEYGFILPDLKGCSYEICNININDIIFGNLHNYKESKNENLSHYFNNRYDNIRGIVIPIDNKFRLIDGYHRCLASTSNLVKVLKAIKN